MSGESLLICIGECSQSGLAPFSSRPLVQVYPQPTVTKSHDHWIASWCLLEDQMEIPVQFQWEIDHTPRQYTTLAGAGVGAHVMVCLWHQAALIWPCGTHSCAEEETGGGTATSREFLLLGRNPAWE